MDKIEKIRQEIKRRYDYENEMYHKKKPDGRPNDGWAESLAIMGVLEELLTFLDTLSEEPDRPEPYTGKYDEAYLNEKIKKASEHWKGVDVDKMLAECRGYDEEPDKSLEEAAEEYIKDGRYLPEAFVVRPAFIAGAEWMAKQMMNEHPPILDKYYKLPQKR